jgi:short-subunit dehydrogenase
MSKHFSGKVCLITGGTSGIGAELVKQLLAQDAHVLVVARNQEHGETFITSLQASERVTFYACNMTDANQVAELFTFAASKYAQIDYVFNNAGTFLGGEMRDTPLESWHAINRSNTIGAMNGAEAAYRQLLKQGHGHLVNTASAAGLFPIPTLGIYGSTKYALVGLSHAMRLEARDLGVQVSVACPTLVNTPLYDNAEYHNMQQQKALRFRNRVQSVDKAARAMLRGVRRNRATIHTSWLTYLTWLLYRIAPSVYNGVCILYVRRYRKTLRGNNQA